MYYAYIKDETGFNSKKLLGKFKEYDLAWERVEAELEKDPEIKYVIEETNGSFDSYGELLTTVIDEN
jgi:hypothetical protein